MGETDPDPDLPAAAARVLVGHGRLSLPAGRPSLPAGRPRLSAVRRPPPVLGYLRLRLPCRPCAHLPASYPPAATRLARRRRFSCLGARGGTLAAADRPVASRTRAASRRAPPRRIWACPLASRRLRAHLPGGCLLPASSVPVATRLAPRADSPALLRARRNPNRRRPPGRFPARGSPHRRPPSRVSRLAPFLCAGPHRPPPCGIILSRAALVLAPTSSSLFSS